MNQFKSENSGEVKSSTRDALPTHYILKIKSFSLLLKSSIKEYESGVFNSGGYKWKLVLHPNGDKDRNVDDHVSLYLVITETDSLPSGWEVHVFFRFLLFDQIQDKYVTFEGTYLGNEGRNGRFHAMKTEQGFPRLIPNTTLNDPGNGYIVKDTCVFGVEVFVCKSSGKGECLSMMKNTTTCIHTWKIENFSVLIMKGEIHYSEVFSAGDTKWKIKLFPKGNGDEKNKSVSIYLVLVKPATLGSVDKAYAEFKLCMKDQKDGNHIENRDDHWFTSDWGWKRFMALDEMNDTTKGFLVNDTCIIEAEVTVYGVVNLFQ